MLHEGGSGKFNPGKFELGAFFRKPCQATAWEGVARLAACSAHAGDAGKLTCICRTVEMLENCDTRAVGPVAAVMDMCCSFFQPLVAPQEPPSHVFHVDGVHVNRHPEGGCGNLPKFLEIDIGQSTHCWYARFFDLF